MKKNWGNVTYGLIEHGMYSPACNSPNHEEHKPRLRNPSETRYVHCLLAVDMILAKYRCSAYSKDG